MPEYKYFDPTETIRQNLANAEQRIFELRQMPEPAFTEQKAQDQIDATQSKIEALEAQLPTSNPIEDQALSDALAQAEYNAHRAKAGRALEAKLTEAVEADLNAKSIDDLDPDVVLEVVAQIKSEIATREETTDVAIRDVSDPKATINK